MDKRQFLQFAAAQGALATLPMPAFAQGVKELRMAIAVAPTSLDPHFQDVFTNTQALLQVYQPLLGQDPTGALIPYLASSWKTVDDTTWEVKLRPGVKFHDGTPFEAEDVAFSFSRVPNVPGAIAPFTANVRDIKAVEVVSPDTVRIKLGAPDPIFDYKLGQVCMLSRKLHANAVPADFNSGKLAIGTGPYKFGAFTSGEKLELVANADYWGGKPAWDKVGVKYIVDPGARIAALKAGEVDLIDGVPVQDIASLQSDAKVALFSSPAFLNVYLVLDGTRDSTPFILDNAGQPLKKNPLQDVRVRKALTLAVDRAGIVSRLMAGQGSVADQLAGLPVPDRVTGLPPLKQDIEQAKKLLKEAGYPDGFRLTIHGPNGWFANDTKVIQAVAQGFSRIGVKTEVEVLPTAVLQSRAKTRSFSVSMSAFQSAYALVVLRYTAMTPDAAAGNGTSNLTHYSNAKIDKLMTGALKEMDPAKRKAMTQEAMREYMADAAMIPLFYTKPNWAGRKDRVVYSANAMSRTSAFYARPV
jgi:peptide/nickel transport system substrate-binding protein